MSQCCNHAAGERRSKIVAGMLERPRYSRGLILEDSDLTGAVDYTRELSRLLFRSLFGCGVACGLKVSVNTDCDLNVTVAPGLALDGCGDPIQLTGSVTITLTERDGFPRTGGSTGKQDFWVVLCGKEKYCAPRKITCEDDDQDGTTQMTRVREHAEVSIMLKQPTCICGHVVTDPSKTLAAEANALVDPDWKPPQTPLDADCPKDCGCADPRDCSCGCCVLLAWVHWFPKDAHSEGGWGVLHRGVRRFVRPQMADDPLTNKRPGASAGGGTPTPVI